MSSVLDRLRDLLRSDDDIVADELRTEAAARGCTSLQEARDREVVMRYLTDATAAIRRVL